MNVKANTNELVYEQIVRFANNEDVWERLHAQQMIEGLGNSELNCIDVAGRNEHPTVTSVAQAVGMTPGAVYKIFQRLQKKRILASYRLPDNQKEVYYRLTASGKKAFDAHAARHEQWRKWNLDFFSSYKKEDLKTILQFLEAYNAKYESILTRLEERA